MPASLPNRGYAAWLQSAVFALAAAVVSAAPAEACPTLPRAVQMRIAEQYRQDRLRADVVVVGTWHSSQNEAECGTFEKPCLGKIVAEKVYRGKKMAEYTVAHISEFNMCDGRNLTPPDGAHAKFYINGSPKAGYSYSLVDKVWIERE